MPGFGLGPSGWTLFTYFVEAVVFLILIGVVWRGGRISWLEQLWFSRNFT